MKLSILIILGAATLISGTPQGPLNPRHKWKVGQRVNTSSGPVDGHPAPNATGVSEYLGIPFAKPPVGDLRFEPPQPYVGKSAISGSSFGNSCPQILPTALDIQQQYDSAPPGLLTPVWLTWNLGQIDPPVTLSEDCLTLNIWTKPQVGDAPKAVLVWIYGGGFVQGVTQIRYNYGQHLAEEGDVVVVSLNYRLGILGFPGSPSGPFNSGLLDQRLAIEWIHANIASFGGDPSRITLIGQSAGANSIDFYTYAYPKDHLIAGTIMESGTAFSNSFINQSSAAESWFTASSAVGCGGEDAGVEAVWKCMKTVPWDTLLAAVPALYAFWPTIDSTLIFSNYSDLTPAAVPLLIGNNENEAGSVKIPTLFSPNTTLPDSYWDNLALISATCPAGERANASLRNLDGVPVWRYRWFGDFADLQLTTNPDSGAWHGEEIAVIWDTVPKTEGVEESERERKVAEYTRGAWAAFAKDPWEGLARYDAWPKWDPEGKTLIRLAYGNETGKDLVWGEVYDEGCAEAGVSLPAVKLS